MFCTNCGERLEDGMMFCPNCGTKIIWETESEEEGAKGEEFKAEESKVEALAEGQTEDGETAVEAKLETAIETKTETVEEAKTEVAEETKTEAVEETKTEVAEETKTEAAEGIKTEAAEETKTEVAEETKTEVAEETKIEAAEGAKIEAAEEVKTEAAEEVKTEKAEGPKAEEKQKKKGGFGALVFLFCLLILFCGLFASVSGALRLSYSESKARSMLDRLDVAEITVPSTRSDQEVPLIDFLEEASGFDFEKTAGVNKKDVEKLLGKSYVKDMAADFIAGYVGYFMGGKKPEAFTRDDVVDFVKEHDDDFFELMKFRFTYPDPVTKERTVYTVDIDNAFKDLGTDEITLDWVEDQTGANFGLIRTFLSVPALIVSVCLCLALALLNVFIAKSKASGLRADGIAILITGVIVAGASGIGMIVFGGRKSSILWFFLSPFLKNALLIGVVVLVAGFLCILLSVLTGKKEKKEKKVQTE